MVFGLFVVFCIITPSIVTAFPLSQAEIPAPLLPVVPTCALSCVHSFLQKGFPPACVTSTDLGCICSRYSQGGFTLGEGVYSCVLSFCPGGTRLDFAPFYELCLSRESAVRPTHKTLILTTIASNTASSRTTPSQQHPKVTATSKASRSPTSLRPSASRSSSRQVQEPSKTSRPQSTSRLKTATSTPRSTRPSSQTRLSTAQRPSEPTRSPVVSDSPAPSEEQGLNTVQIAGLSAAGGSALILVVCGIILISCCRKNRRRRHKGRTAFSHGAESREKAANRPDTIEKCGAPHYQGDIVVAGTAAYTKRKDGFLQLQTGWEVRGPKPEEIGIAISPETDKKASPTSDKSTRAMSVLLPAKPDFCHIKPLTLHRPESAMTETTFIEVASAGPVSAIEDKRMTLGYSGQPLRINSSSVQQPGSSYNSSQPHREIGGGLPKVEDCIFRAPRTGSSQYSLGPGLPSQRESNITSKSEKEDYLPRYYTAFQYSPSSARASPTSRNYGRRSARDSVASLTSFESADVQDPTPEEEEDKQLSPVPESPMSSLRYPKVPRASNQAVPRSPTAPAKPKFEHQQLSPGRKSEHAAREVERMLWTMGSNPSKSDLGTTTSSSDACNSTTSCNSSPAIRDLRSQYPSQNASQLSLLDRQRMVANKKYSDHHQFQMHFVPKSPWEPTITPLRRGSELFLTVS